MIDLDRPQQITTALHEHYCSTPGCDKWGGYGFAKTANVETRWYCWVHYPYKEAPRGQKLSDR